MPFVSALGTAKVELRYQIDGQRIENLLYFYLGANPTDGDFEALGEALLVWYEDTLAPTLTTAIALHEVFITDLSSSTGPVFSLTPAEGAIRGVRSVTSLPSGNALCVSFRTNGRGRSARGRNYVAGLGISDTNESIFLPSPAENVRSAYSALLSTGVVGTAVWSVVSTIHAKAPREAALVQPITGAVLTDLAIDSQRRRLPGRGN